MSRPKFPPTDQSDYRDIVRRLEILERSALFRNLQVLDTTGGEDPTTTPYLLQAGSSVLGTNGSGDGTITYPTPFSIATIWVVMCEGDITHVPAIFMPHAYTTTTFTYRMYHSDTGAAWVSSGNHRVNWLALGY